MEKENLKIERAYMLLEEREWTKAREQADRILDENPKNADAHFIKLLADYRVKNKEQLLELNKNFENNINYKRVLQFGDNELVGELKNYLSVQGESGEKRMEQLNEKIARYAWVLMMGIGFMFFLGLFFFVLFSMLSEILPENVTIVVGSLILTLLMYLTAPIIYRVATGGTTVKKARKYAIINSVVGWLLFNLVYLIMDVNAGANTIASITYYFIGKSIFTSKEEKIKRKVKEVEQKCGVKSIDEKQEKKDFIP